MAGLFLISADNAHGYHPNYGEKFDPTNHPVLGGGPVIKVNANCKYMTDADMLRLPARCARLPDVPCRSFVNHSDSAGGSTRATSSRADGPARRRHGRTCMGPCTRHARLASTLDHIYTIKGLHCCLLRPLSRLMSSYLDGLNNAQLDAVRTTERAGSRAGGSPGKTRALTARHCPVDLLGIDPASILCDLHQQGRRRDEDAHTPAPGRR